MGRTSRFGVNQELKTPARRGGGAESDGEALRTRRRAWDPPPRQKPAGILEQVRCPHWLSGLLAGAMDLVRVELVDCAAGCGHRLYSDRGQVECPCHWPASQVSQVARALQEGNHMRAGATERRWDVLEDLLTED